MKLFKLVMFLIAAFMAFSMALAQSLSDLNFAQWLSDPAVFAVGLAGLVKLIRERFPQIDGKFQVAALGIVLGALIGAGGQLAQLLTVAPFSTWSFPWGGLAYGAATGVAAFLGVNVFDLLAGRWAKALGGGNAQPAGDTQADYSRTRDRFIGQ